MRSPEEIQSWQQENLVNHKFYIDMVAGGDPQVADGMYNIHTHGLAELLDHPDLQIVMPMPPNMAGHIMHNVVNLIKAGTKFKDGDISTDVIQASDDAKDCPVRFVAAKETHRDVLRIIMPDRDFQILPELMTGEAFLKQYEKLDGGEPVQ